MRISVLIEVTCPPHISAEGVFNSVQNLQLKGFTVDKDYEPVIMQGDTSSHMNTSAIVHGWLDSSDDIQAIKELQEVIDVWVDTVIAPFDDSG